MKKLDYTQITPAALQRVKSGSLDILQRGNKEVIQKIIKNIYGIGPTDTDIYVLYGCVNSGSGANYDISAGAVYYNGEVYDVAATTFTAGGGETAVATILTTPIVGAGYDPTTFTDGSTPNVHLDVTIKIASANTGTGIADYSDFNFEQSETAWKFYVIPDGMITTIGGGISVYNVKFFNYKIIGKTLHFQLFISLTLTGTPGSVSVDLSEIFVGDVNIGLQSMAIDLTNTQILLAQMNPNSSVALFTPAAAWGAGLMNFALNGTVSIQ